MIRGVSYRRNPNALGFDDGNGETVDFDDDRALRLHLPTARRGSPQVIRMDDRMEMRTI